MSARGLEELESGDSETELLQSEVTEELSARELPPRPQFLSPWRKVLTLGAMGAAAGLLVCFAFYQVADSRGSSESALPTAKYEASISSISSTRFLKSDELMGVVADHWAQNNPQCQRNDNQLPAVCRTEVLQPEFAEAMHSQVDRRLEQIPELRRLLNDIHMNEDDQEKVKGAVSHVFDPLMASIYKDAVGVMSEHAASGPDVLHQKLKEKLQPREAEMRQLRSKLLPGVERVSDGDTFKPYFKEHGVTFSGESKGWNLRLDVSVAKSGAAADALWPGRQLATNATAAPATPPPVLATVATTPAPVYATAAPVYATVPPTTTTEAPPPNSVAANVVAALDIPFSHMIVSILYAQGKLYLPKWLKIVMTIEDALIFNPILLILDSCLIFG